MRNYFTFDGVDSRSFGVYISGQGTFKAPARSYDALEIPGRNGALLGIDSRLGNVELTYPAFIYSNFAENIAAFRAFLLSHKGYFKLKDSYHPDEFRLAYYPGPFEPDVTSANNAGSFDITFICKPQRYLESGEEVIELIPGQTETHTYTGNPASFVALVGDQITSLQIPLRSYQNLHGYDHPWPAGGGKNVLNLADAVVGNDWLIHDITDLILLGQAFYVSASITNLVGNMQIQVEYTKEGTTQRIFGNLLSNASGKLEVSGTIQSFDANTNVRLILKNQTSASVSDYFMTYSSDHSFSPYSNICPISGLTGLSVYVSPTQDPQDATTYAVDWTTQAGTVYGGTLDVVTGLLTVDRVCEMITKDSAWYSFSTGTGNSSAAVYLEYYNNCKFVDGISSRNGAISSTGKESENYWYSPRQNEVPEGDMCFAYSYTGFIRFHRTDVANITDLNAFKAAFPDTQVCYYLATPITYQLTPVQIAALLAGETFAWSSNNEGVTVEVASVVPTILENPTLFDALPFLRVYGTGILGIGSHTITITAADVYTDIDCEMMDCFKGSANKNQYVQFSGNDFPTLEPGVNGFSFSGITKVEVKPRWWSV